MNKLQKTIFMLLMTAIIVFGLVSPAFATEWVENDGSTSNNPQTIKVVLNLNDGQTETIYIPYAYTMVGPYNNAYWYVEQLDWYNIEYATITFPRMYGGRNYNGGEYNWYLGWSGDYADDIAKDNYLMRSKWVDGGVYASDRANLWWNFKRLNTYYLGNAADSAFAIGWTENSHYYKTLLQPFDLEFSEDTDVLKYIYLLSGSRYNADVDGNPQDTLLGALIGIRSDHIAPKIETVPGAGNLNTTQVTLYAHDDESGLSAFNEYNYYVSTSGTKLVGGEWKTYEPEGTDITFDGEGQYWIFTNIIEDAVNADKGGKNKIPATGRIGNTDYYVLGPYNIDTTPPTITANETDLWVKNIDLTITANDPDTSAGSGISENNTFLYFLSELKSGATPTNDCPLTEWASITESALTVSNTIAGLGSGLTGEYRVYIGQVMDNAGNLSTGLPLCATSIGDFHYTTVKLDNKGPVVTAPDADASPALTRGFVINVYEPHSGLNETNSYQYFLSADASPSAVSDLETYTPNTAFTVSGYSGDYYMYVKQVADNLGNISVPDNIVTIDGINYHKFGPYAFAAGNPTISASPSRDLTFTSSKDILITLSTPSDGFSNPVYNYFWSVYKEPDGENVNILNYSGSNQTITFSASGTYYLFVRELQDNNGNYTPTDVTVNGVKYKRFGPYYFDNVAPGVDVTDTSDNAYRIDTTYTKEKVFRIKLYDNSVRY